MAVTSTTPLISFNGNGSTTEFAFNFVVPANPTGGTITDATADTSQGSTTLTVDTANFFYTTDLQGKSITVTGAGPSSADLTTTIQTVTNGTTITMTDAAGTLTTNTNISVTTGAFGTTLKNNGDLEVYVDGVIKTITTDYTVLLNVGDETNKSGKVIFNTAPANNSVVTIVRDIELDRTVDFQAGGSLTASALNSQFDTIVMALQDNIQGQDQAISFPPDEALTVSQRTLPAKANRFNKLLAFDGTGTLTLTSDITSGDGNVTANVVTANTFVGLTGFSGTFTGSLIGTASSIANHDTDALSEGTSNLYFTNARADGRFDTKLAASDTDDLSEGSTNLYYTNTRADARISSASIGDLSDVDLTGQSSTNNTLNYNQSSGKWEAQAPDFSNVSQLTVNGNVSIGGGAGQHHFNIDSDFMNPAGSGLTFTGTWNNLGTVTTTNIDGGTIDGTVIGGATKAAGSFTNLTTTGSVNLSGLVQLGTGAQTTGNVDVGNLRGQHNTDLKILSRGTGDLYLDAEGTGDVILPTTVITTSDTSTVSVGGRNYTGKHILRPEGATGGTYIVDALASNNTSSGNKMVVVSAEGITLDGASSAENNALYGPMGVSIKSNTSKVVATNESGENSVGVKIDVPTSSEVKLNDGLYLLPKIVEDEITGPTTTPSSLETRVYKKVTLTLEPIPNDTHVTISTAIAVGDEINIANTSPLQKGWAGSFHPTTSGSQTSISLTAYVDRGTTFTQNTANPVVINHINGTNRTLNCSVTAQSVSTQKYIGYKAGVDTNLSSDSLTEGSTNLYFTNARADARFDTKIALASIGDLSDVGAPGLSNDGKMLVWNNSTGTAEFNIVPATSVYSQINVPGSTNLVAASSNDTLRLTAGTNMTITTTESNGIDEVVFNATSDVVSDTSPELGGDLESNGNDIIMENSADVIKTAGGNHLNLNTSESGGAGGNIYIAPNGNGGVYIDGLAWPGTAGANGQVLTTNGSNSLSWTTVSSGGGGGGATTFLGLNDTPGNYTGAGDKFVKVLSNGTGLHFVDAQMIPDVASDTTPQLGGDLDTQAFALTGTTVTPSTAGNGGFDSSDSRAVRLQGPTAGKDHAIIMQQGSGQQSGRQNIAFVMDIDGSYSGQNFGGGNIGSGLIYSPLNMQIRDHGHASKTRTTFDIGVPYRGNTGSTITDSTSGATGKLLDVANSSRDVYLQNTSGTFAVGNAITGVVTGTITAVDTSIGTNAVKLTIDTNFSNSAAQSDLADVGFARFSARDVLNTNGMRTSEPELHLEAGRIALESNGTKMVDCEDDGTLTLLSRASNKDIILKPDATGATGLSGPNSGYMGYGGGVVHTNGVQTIQAGTDAPDKSLLFNTGLQITGVDDSSVADGEGFSVPNFPTLAFKSFSGRGNVTSGTDRRDTGGDGYGNIWFQRYNKDKNDGSIQIIQNGQILGGFFGGGSISSAGYHTSDYSQFSGSNTASMFMRATDDWTLSSHPSRLEFQACPSGSTTRNNVLDINGDSVVVNPKNENVDFRVNGDANDNVLFVDASTELVGIKAQPDLGAGLHIKTNDTGGTVSGDADELVIEGGADAGLTILGTNSNRIFFGDASSPAPGYIRYFHSDDHMDFGVGDSERMRIKSDGRICFGVDTQQQDGRFTMQGPFSTNRGLVLKTTENGGTAIYFDKQGSGAGYIQINTNNTVSYNTSSDYRLKENVDYDFDATTRLKQLKPARFSWKVDDTNTLVDGFIAHEVSNVVPEAISGEKDATETYTDDNGEEQTRIVPQGIDQSKLVPLLVKTIQELEARITDLENGS